MPERRRSPCPVRPPAEAAGAAPSPALPNRGPGSGRWAEGLPRHCLRARAVLRPAVLVLRFRDRGAARGARGGLPARAGAPNSDPLRCRGARRKARGCSTRCTSAAARPRGSAARGSRGPLPRCAERARLAPGAGGDDRGQSGGRRRGRRTRWVAAGVNRLSLGVQSFDDARPALDAPLARSAAAWRRPWRRRARAGLANVSVDLIFALPSLLDRDWERDVAAAPRATTRRTSRSTGSRWRPGRRSGAGASGALVDEAPEDRYEAEFLRAHAMLAAAGFEHYEVSNYARPGFALAAQLELLAPACPTPASGRPRTGSMARDRRWNVAPYADWHAAAGGRARPGRRNGAPHAGEPGGRDGVPGTAHGRRTRRSVPASGELVAPWLARGGGHLVGDRAPVDPARLASPRFPGGYLDGAPEVLRYI